MGHGGSLPQVGLEHFLGEENALNPLVQSLPDFPLFLPRCFFPSYAEDVHVAFGHEIALGYAADEYKGGYVVVSAQNALADSTDRLSIELRHASEYDAFPFDGKPPFQPQSTQRSQRDSFDPVNEFPLTKVDE